MPDPVKRQELLQTRQKQVRTSMIPLDGNITLVKDLPAHENFSISDHLDAAKVSVSLIANSVATKSRICLVIPLTN
ncbi:MAG UNVERIFIED_CONTAM: hypothetical protein LVR29_30235 [Microcystis novacekii LVE1205-3]|jgi:arachidonate 15-lipoxygenase